MVELGTARSRAEDETRLTTTSGASYVEAVNGNVEVFFVCCFFPGIELAAFVDVFAARHACTTCKFLLVNPVVPKWACKKERTFHGKGSHEANRHYFWANIFRDAGSGDFGWVEVRGVVLL